MDHPLNPSKPFWRFFLFVYLAFTLTVSGLNSSYLFSTKLYEAGDIAANSLAIQEAKHFQRLTGQYSRWGFSHPGPGLFYVMAAGEAFFYDALHLTATPVNAQILAILLFNSWFVAASIAIVARERGEWLAVALCLVGLIVHLATLGPIPLLSNWPAHTMMLPFACLIVAAASVGSGRGRDLPFLIVAGAALLNSHVAQPLFVGPLLSLAYIGLLRNVKEKPWQAFPRAHVISCFVLLLAALPVMLDVLYGSKSNFHLILDHLRTHAGEKHPWRTALAYCLRFATYKPSISNEAELIENPTWVDTGQYMFRHERILIEWAFLAGLMAWRLRESLFRMYLVGGILLACLLSLYWAHIQDGELFYFNSWFFYGILLSVMFAAVTGIVTVIETYFPKLVQSRILLAASATLVMITLVLTGRRLHLPNDSNTDSAKLFASVKSALKIDSAETGKIKFLAFAHDQWGDAVGVALQLARQGKSFRVEQDWGLIFGQGNVLKEGTLHASQLEEMQIWHVLPRDENVIDANPFPLPDDTCISLTQPKVDPAAGTTISFCGAQPNAARFVVVGWSGPGTNEPFSWTDETEGILQFHAEVVPASATVEIYIDAFPALMDGRIKQQRTSLSFNGTSIGEWRTNKDMPMMAKVPAALWNAQPDAKLVWQFPDAVSPKHLNLGSDDRNIAFGFRKVVFTIE